MGIFSDLHTQLFFKPATPTADFLSKPIIVTGANVGLGEESSRHIVRPNPYKANLAVRSIKKKGEAAEAEIEAEINRIGVVEVYEFDCLSYDSFKAFTPRLTSFEPRYRNLESWCSHRSIRFVRG